MINETIAPNFITVFGRTVRKKRRSWGATYEVLPGYCIDFYRGADFSYGYQGVTPYEQTSHFAKPQSVIKHLEKCLRNDCIKAEKHAAKLRAIIDGK